LPVSPMADFEVSVARWWRAVLDVEQGERFFAGILLGGGLLGAVGLLFRKCGAAGLMYGATALALPALSPATSLWEPLQVIGAAKLMALAGGFAAIPFASAVAGMLGVIGRTAAKSLPALVFGTGIVSAAGLLAFHHAAEIPMPTLRARPVTLGLSAEQQAVVKALRSVTQADGRILWEERPTHPMPCWSALLPDQTQRHYLGGLMPDAAIEHHYARLTGGMLAGRPLAGWVDGRLKDFCERSMVSFTACWWSESIVRFRAWPATETIAALHDKGDGWLLAIKRTPSFVLKGKARVIQLDSQRVALA